MKQLLILSGKGGTGKTTIASAFVKLSGTKVVADCDVDAPNLHLVLENSKPKVKDFYGLPIASIDTDLCINCGACQDICRFDAINVINEAYVVDKYSCEGCKVCDLVCPAGAITINDAVSGELRLYEDSRYFSTAKLKMGSGTSGKLVSEVKAELKANPYEEEELTIIDGSPGIGCPVIASISGVDYVLIVSEPSISGLSDMKRIVQTAKQFNTPVGVCLNKYNGKTQISEDIMDYCKENKISFLGTIPYDKSIVKALNSGGSILDNISETSNMINDVYNKTIKIMEEV